MRDLIKDDTPSEFASWMKSTEEEAFREGHRNAALQKKRLQEIDRNVRHEMEMAAQGKRSREADELQRMMEGLALRQTQEEQDTSKRFHEREQKLWAVSLEGPGFELTCRTSTLPSRRRSANLPRSSPLRLPRLDGSRRRKPRASLRRRRLRSPERPRQRRLPRRRQRRRPPRPPPRRRRQRRRRNARLPRQRMLSLRPLSRLLAHAPSTSGRSGSTSSGQ